MTDLVTEAHQFQILCQRMGWQFCFIGGLTVQHWGEPRLTRDVDVTILTGFGTEQDFVSGILEAYEARRPDAEEFALQHRVLLVRGSSGIGLDISLGALPFEAQMISRATEVQFIPGIKLRICSPEDLIVLKSFAGRAQDWVDVSSVIVRQGSDSLDWGYIISNLAPLVALKEEAEILDRLDSLREAYRA